MLPACTSAGPEDGGPPPRRLFNEVFTVEGPLVLGESEEVINVGISVTPDPEGGILVADFREHRVRSYADDGSLLWQFGRSGSGPGEFGSIQAALRLPDGRVMVAELSGKITLLGSDPMSVSSTSRPQDARMLEELDLLADGRVLVSARWLQGEPDGGLLRVLDPRTGQTDASFFVPYVPAHIERGANVSGWATSDVRGDTIATMFAWSDTIYLHSPAGRLHDRIPVRSGFVTATVSPEEFHGPVGWLRHHSRFQDIEWMSDGRFLLQYAGGVVDVPTTGTEPRFHMVLLSRDGSGLAEVTDSPRFHAVDDEGRIYFDDPEALEAGRLMIARLSGDFRE